MVDMAGKSCLDQTCHGDLVAQSLVHPPAMQGNCEVCHTATWPDSLVSSGPTPHLFQTSSPTLALCGKCHTELGQEHKVRHTPFHEQCTACHDPHGGAKRYYFVKDDPNALCLGCHADLLKDMKYLHAPVAFESCGSCHTAHDSDYESLLARPPERVCLYCHIDFRDPPPNAIVVHQPMRDACYGCHNPHGGNHRAFLPTDQTQLCGKCHEDLIQRMTSVTYGHAAMVEKKKCSDCHHAHWSESTSLLKTSSMEICLECHRQPVIKDGGGTVTAVGEYIERSRFLHGPITHQDCTPCHAAHGSNDPRLMKDNFPVGFYASYSPEAYALCFECHDSAIIEPDRPFATGFRNGEKNLHAFHVMDVKGRSCRACHQEHASNRAFHIRDWVMFGTWKMELAFTQTPNGGTCATGCHARRGYDRINPVQNVVSAPSAPVVAAAGSGSTGKVAAPPARFEIDSKEPALGSPLRPGIAAPDFLLRPLGSSRTVSLSATARTRLLVFVRPNQRFTSETLKMCERLLDKVPGARDRLSAYLVWVGDLPAGERDLLQFGFPRPWIAIHDPDAQAARAWRLVVSPTAYLVDRRGTVTHVFAGWEPRLEMHLLDAVRHETGLSSTARPPADFERLSPEERVSLLNRLAREFDLQGRAQEARALRRLALSVRPNEGPTSPTATAIAPDGDGQSRPAPGPLQTDQPGTATVRAAPGDRRPARD